MNKSAIFKAAHALTKATVKAGDSYQVTFAAALRIIIAESKAPKTLREMLIAAGAKVWTASTGKMSRVYVTQEAADIVFNNGLLKGWNVNPIRISTTSHLYLSDHDTLWSNSGAIRVTLNATARSTGYTCNKD